MSKTRFLNGKRVDLQPLAAQVLDMLWAQRERGLSQMDAMRTLGVAGGSFTKRISDLRKVGAEIITTSHKDPLQGNRRYNRWTIKTK